MCFTNKVIVIGILLCLSISVKAQGLKKAEVDSAIFKMVHLFKDKYVFADKGKGIGAFLQAEHKAGRFRTTRTWKELADTLTKLLQEYSSDGHVYVTYDPKAVKRLLYPNQSGSADEVNSEAQPSGVNHGFAEAKVLSGNIGYLKMTEVDLSEKSIPILLAAMKFLSNTKALVIDLQNNGGGGGDTGPIFESIFLPKGTPLLQFTSRDGQSSIDKTLDWVPVKYNNPLYILVNEKTASAAEYYAFVLHLKKRATIVGQKSAGGAHMNEWFPINTAIFLSVSTAAPTIPGTQESWEGKGVPVDHMVEKGQELPLIYTIEKVATPKRN